MLSFISITIALAAFSGGSVALPTSNGAVARRSENFLFPFLPPLPPPPGPIVATGANGGYNYGGSGANGGAIDINALRAGSGITASGANGGVNFGRREEDFFFPVWVPPASSPARGAITATGANGGYNYGGSGANGGSISIGRRAEEKENFFFPLWIPPAPPAANGPITANGANGGTNIYGNGANGGTISIH